MPFVSKSQRRKFYALKNEGKMDQATIDEWEKDTPQSIPERIGKMASFYEGFEKRALSTKAKVGLGLGAAALGGLGVAKAVQPYDVVQHMTDIHSNRGPKGAKRPPVHMTVSKKRPLFFGRSDHMAQAKKPKHVAMAMGSPLHSAIAAKKVAKGMKGRLAYTPEYRKHFIATQRKKPFMSSKGVNLDDARSGSVYDRITR